MGKTHPAEACDRNEPRGGAAHPVAERQQGHPCCRSRFAAPFARRRWRRLLELLASFPAGSPPPPCSVRLLFLDLTRLPGERRRACCATPSHTCASPWLAPFKKTPAGLPPLWPAFLSFERRPLVPSRFHVVNSAKERA